MFHSRLSLFLISLALLVSNSALSQEASSLEGVWQMRGYGWIFSIDKEQLQAYDITSMSCTPSATYPSEMILGDYNVQGNVLTTKVGLSTYVLDKLDGLPDLCGVTLSRKQKKDPVHNFEVLWHTFNEQYAYFDLRGTDWDASYKKYRSQVTNKTSDVELYAIVYKMLDEIGDGHVDIEASDKIMEKALGEEEEGDDISFKDLWMEIAHHYVKDLKTHNYTKSVWGTINDKVGYVQVNDMVAQAHYGITPDMPKQEAQKLYIRSVENTDNHMRDETEGMRRTMQNVLKDLEGVEHIIVDVRFNGGGFDTVSYEIIRALTGETFVGFKKYAKLGNDTTTPYFYEVTPAKNAFTGKVYILQSPFSGSATETMLLASMQMPNVIRVGSASEGILSDALEKVLPNGWTFTLSNEAYVTPDGVNYEDMGIPVDQELNYSRDAQVFYNNLKTEITTTSKDSGIEFIINTFTNN